MFRRSVSYVVDLDAMRTWIEVGKSFKLTDAVARQRWSDAHVVSNITTTGTVKRLICVDIEKLIEASVTLPCFGFIDTTT